ncbi:MAG TPA: hypothetical protein VHF22_10630, partial [Planctomycetota bacterium]|nr:hypothetical protein [Planctomycetota bacterium]
MLIVALGVLTLISVMAVTFVTLMRLEKNAATNFVDGVKAKLCADSGMERFIADMRRTAVLPPFNGTNPSGAKLQPFIYGADYRTNPVGKTVDVAKPVEQVDPADPTQVYFWGKLGVSYPGGVDEYRIKVVDASSLFDLNFPIEYQPGTTPPKPQEGQVLERMLDTLGYEIAQDRQRKGLPVIDPINGTDPQTHRNAISYNGQTGAKALLSFRLALEGKRFASKSQLQEIMEDSCYQAFIDYVTVYGAYNDLRTRPNPGEIGPHSNITEVNEEKEGTGQRARINVNLVSRPVLIAAIAPLCGRRHVYKMAPPVFQAMEGGSGAAFEAYKKPGMPNGFTQQEDLKFDVREGWLYVGPFGSAGHLERAEALADWIIANRPFLSYADFQDRVLQSRD